MTLDECINYAVENSYKTNIQKTRTDDERLNYTQAIMNHLPSISGSVGIETAFGRSVDPETNTYINQSNLSNAYSLSGNIPIFNRNEKRHNVKLAKNNLTRAKLTNAQDIRTLESEIRQALMELSATKQARNQSFHNVEYQKLANEAISKRYEKGLSSIIELQTSDVDLFKAELEYRNAILKHQIKIREVNYYKGVPFYFTENNN